MNIHGLQKLTLLDYPGKCACTVFLAGCNFYCPFCHNADLVTGDAETVIDDHELLSFLQKRRGLLDGVCVTGGEPLLRKDLAELLDAIKKLGFLVKLDTNGTFPDRLKNLIDADLVDYVAMDIKNCPSRYWETAGLALAAQVKPKESLTSARAGYMLQNIKESINFLLTEVVEYEFRTTVVKEFHDAQAFAEIGPWIEGASKYFLQHFEERESVIEEGLHACSKEEMEAFAEIVRPYVGEVSLRGI